MDAQQLNEGGEDIVIDATGERDEAAELRSELEAHRQSNRALLSRIREGLLASEPSVSPELVTGDTLEELEQSFAAAVALVSRVREAVEAERPPAVGGGAPGRAPLFGPQSAFEKIREGLAAR